MGIPYIKSYTIAGLEEFITNEGFEIIDSHKYFPTPPRLFAVARKNE